MLQTALHTVRRALIVVAVLSLAACATIPYAKVDELPPPAQVVDGSPERAALNAEVYDTAVRYVRRVFYKRDFGGVRFVEEAEARRAAALAEPDANGFYARLKALLDVLDDDHTQALSPIVREREHAARLGDARAGVGMVITPRGDDRYVALVRPDTPAAEAGVLSGWKIESIDGRSPLVPAPPVIGRANRIVFVDDAGERHVVDLTPVPLPPHPRFETRALDDGVAYIRFDDFDRPRFDQFKAEMERLSGDPPPGLIIDLRFNGGGELRLAALISSWFFDDEQAFVVIEGRFLNRRVTVDGAENPYLGPVVIVTGPGSASAAELLAGVLQEKGRVAVVGATTRGAVTGTRAINLPDGGLLRVGEIVMTTPGRRSLEKVGVIPDVPVPDDWRAVRQGRDPPLEAALTAVRARAASAPDGADPG